MPDKKALPPGIVKAENFAIIKTDTEQVLSTLRENLGTDGLQPWDLDRVGVPPGGGSHWMVPTVDGDPNPEKELVGVLVYQKQVRAWWERDIDDGGGGGPPDCRSSDGIHGQGKMAEKIDGRLCQNCPAAQWGSGRKGSRGQDCRLMRQMFLMRKDDVLPCLVTIPPTSLRASKKFLLGLFQRQRTYWSVIIGIGLNPTKSQTGQPFSQVTFRVISAMSPELTDKFAAVKNSLAPVFEKAGVE